MLEIFKKNKMNIVMVILFGAIGALIIPVILVIEKLSKKYPTAFKYIALTIYLIIMAVCLYVFIIKHQMTFLPILICMIFALCNIMKKKDN